MLNYSTGEDVRIGDQVVAGGDTFTVDSIDEERGILKGDIDPCGYAVQAVTLLKRA